MAKYKFNIKCGAKLTSVEIEADTYEDALKEVKKQALRYKGEKVDTKFDKNKLDTRDASGVHKITYVDVDGDKVEETIKGDPSLVNKRVSELKNHDCKILKTEMFLNWKKDAKDSEVAWQEFNSNDRVVTKRKEFKDKDARDKFINKLVEKDNFYTILGTRDSDIKFLNKGSKFKNQNGAIVEIISDVDKLGQVTFKIKGKNQTFSDAKTVKVDGLINMLNKNGYVPTKDSVNGSVDDFFNKMKGKSKTEVEKIVILAKGNPNAEKAYIKWKSEAKDALPITYSIKVSEYKGNLMIDVENEYWDSRDYAFYDGRKIYSYSTNAADFVKKALNDLKINPKNLKAGQKIRQKVKDSKVFYVKYVDLKKDDGKELIKYFKDVKEAKKFIDLDGKNIIVKASNITTNDAKKFKLRIYNLSGPNKGNLLKEEFFETKADMQKRYKELFKKENYSLNPTAWYWSGINPTSGGWKRYSQGEIMTKDSTWEITYGKGRPGGNKEIVEYSTYKDAYNHAANNASGWGFEVKKVKDSKPFKVDKVIMHEKDANGKMLYLVKSGDFYVTTVDPTGRGGGIFDVNLKNAQEQFKSNLLITKLEKKYGKQEAYKKYLAGATDASVSVYTGPWSSENGGKQPRGYGSWAFAYTRRPDIKDVFFFSGSYGDCKKKAIEKAKADGKTAIYVLS